MAVPVHRHEVRQLLDRGAQLVEVLDREEYERLHVSGAVNIPLQELGDRAQDELDPARLVVVYCYDALCDMSPRAANRLESLGFTEVYDYVAGKVDWCANSLPCEGGEAAVPRLGELAHPDVPTCEPHESTVDVRQRLADWDVAVVVDAHRVVLGIVRRDDMAEGRKAGEVMREGPVTHRPDVPAADMAHQLLDHPVPRVLVTNGDGTLVGLAFPEDIERAAKH